MQSERIPDEKAGSRLRSLVGPVVYGDVFNCPLTLDELHRFCTLPITREELQAEVQGNGRFSRAVHRQGEYFFLEGREDLVEIREVRRRASEKAWQLARKVMRLIGYVPFIRGALVTGSLAVENSPPGDDLDFLVLTAPRRFWLVFGILGTLQRVFSRQYLCSNYYISVDHLRVPRETFFVAREVVQARPIFGREACREFQEANRWAFDSFPNAASAHSEDKPLLERRGLLRWVVRCIEWPLSGRFGDAIERFLAKRLQRRLVAHYGKHGQEVPEEVLRLALDEVELRFHGLDYENKIIEAVQSRETQLAPILNGHH